MSKDQKLVKIKRDTKSLVMKNLIVMAVLVIIALTGVISWFTNKTEATADGINVKCEAPDGLEIAVVRHGDSPPTDKDFENNGTITLNDDNYPFLKQLSMEEITSDGRYFYKPKITQNSKGASVDTKSDEPWINAENAYTTNFSVNSSLSYLSVDVYMRTQGSHKIILSSSTSVTPQDKDKLTDVKDIANKSNMGAFSKNCIVGAVRVSTVVNDKCNNLWIPAPNIIYEETKDGNGNIITRKVRTDLKKTESEFGTFVHKYWQVNHSTSKRIGDEAIAAAADKVITNDNGDYSLGTNEELLNFQDDKPDKKGYYTGMVTLNLWIDGEDAEARQAFVGGSFSADFKFALN